jgi:hypothetical protein
MTKTHNIFLTNLKKFTTNGVFYLTLSLSLGRGFESQQGLGIFLFKL